MIATAKVFTALKALNGQLFGAEFIKVNGDNRRMVARLGVSKDIVGGGYSHSRDLTRHNITVFEMANGGRYRAIPINRLISLTIGGQTHAVV